MVSILFGLGLLLVTVDAGVPPGVCPDEVECQTDPCLNATCQRFPNALCLPNNCHGNCTAAFYHKANLNKDITSKCKVLTCADIHCPPKRSCIVELVTTSCQNPRKCKNKQHERPHCVLTPKTTPPSDCSMVLCLNGTLCDIKETGIGRVARCVKSKPQTCRQLGPCDRGMKCCKEGRGQSLSVARCVPKHTSSKPHDCSKVKCAEGFVCSVFMEKHKLSRARCIKQSIRPKSCSNLDCESSKMSCREEDTGPVCFIARDCSDISCSKKQNCHVIHYSKRNFTEARCLSRKVGVSPYICDLLPQNFCSNDEVCIDMIQQNHVYGIPQCLQTGCDLNEIEPSSCNLPNHTCLTTASPNSNLSGVASFCVPDRLASSFEFTTSCSSSRQTVCPSNTNGNKTCHEVAKSGLVFGSVCDFSIHSPAAECSELTCITGEECAQEIVPLPDSRADYKQATCVSSVRVDRELENIGGGSRK